MGHPLGHLEHTSASGRTACARSTRTGAGRAAAGSRATARPARKRGARSRTPSPARAAARSDFLNRSPSSCASTRRSRRGSGSTPGTSGRARATSTHSRPAGPSSRTRTTTTGRSSWGTQASGTRGCMTHVTRPDGAPAAGGPRRRGRRDHGLGAGRVGADARPVHARDRAHAEERRQAGR